MFRLSLDGNPPIAAALIAILVRPELAVLVVALPIFREARRPRSLALIAGALAAMTLVRCICFRDFVPNTFWAKSGGDLRHARAALRSRRAHPALAQKPALIVFTKWRDRPWTLDEARARVGAARRDPARPRALRDRDRREPRTNVK